MSILKKLMARREPRKELKTIDDSIVELYSEVFHVKMTPGIFRDVINNYLEKKKIPPEIAYRLLSPEEARMVGFIDGLRNPDLTTMLSYRVKDDYAEGHKAGCETRESIIKLKTENTESYQSLKNSVNNLPML